MKYQKELVAGSRHHRARGDVPLGIASAKRIVTLEKGAEAGDRAFFPRVLAAVRPERLQESLAPARGHVPRIMNGVRSPLATFSRICR
jgi:hypothetical protein